MESEKRMKKKILSILLMGVLIIGLTGCGNSATTEKLNNDNSNTQDEQSSTESNSKSSTKMNLVCNKNDDLNRTVKLVVDNDILITKTFIVSWDNKDEQTCTFYKEESQKHNSYKGVSDSTDCNSKSGKRTVIITISELDKNDVYIPETKFIGSNQKFDINGYKSYMENDGFICTEK